MVNQNYPICKIPSELDYYLSINPELPPKPKEPIKVIPTCPSKPYNLDENQSDSNKFFQIIGAIIFNGLMFYVGFGLKNEFFMVVSIIVIISFIWVISSGAIGKDNKIKKEQEAEYYRKIKEFETQKIKAEEKYKYEFEKYKIQISNYNETIEKLTSESNISKLRKEKKNEFFKKAIRPHKSEKKYKKGVTEDLFYSYLIKYFNNRIMRDLCIVNNEDLFRSKETYLPDYVFFDPESITIDIEVDEPYIGSTGEPIHFMGADDYRDNFFTNNNWIVVRFAEEQILSEPDACCFYIALKIFEFTENSDYLKLFKNEKNPKEIRHWTKDEAHKLAFSRYRNKYLNTKLQEILKDEVDLKVR